MLMLQEVLSHSCVPDCLLVQPPCADALFRWIGVLASYLLRPSATSLQVQGDMRRTQNWQSPIVGVHIRRTDKVTSGEAKLHSVDEYMSHVERWCDWKLPPGWQERAVSKPSADNMTLSNTADRCSIYLATDEPEVEEDIRERYQHIHVITNPVGVTGTRDGWRCMVTACSVGLSYGIGCAHFYRGIDTASWIACPQVP